MSGNQSSVGGPRESLNNSVLNSFINSSDESARGGSTNTERGRAMMMIIADRASEARNRSSENH